VNTGKEPLTAARNASSGGPGTGWLSARGARRRTTRRARRGALTVLAVVLPVVLLQPSGAAATIHAATALDGPLNNILEVDGTAMAADGTGGVVYRKEVGGLAHVFAVPFANGHWGTPVEVDREDLYGATQPAIAAGDGGRLLVVWVQARNTSPENVAEYELMGATLQPGASAFGRAIVIDPNVGEPYTGEAGMVDPVLAMASDGIAYVVYRVLTFACNRLRDPAGAIQWGACPPSSDELMEVRAARYDYLYWNALGAIDRAPQIPLRAPSASNVPAIGIDDLQNNAVVAWQEPESEGVARIWVRRLFATVRGNVLQASPSTLGGHPITTDASAPVVSVSPAGEARVAYSIEGAPGSAVTTTGLYMNLLPSAVDFHGGQLGGATRVAEATQGPLGTPSASIDPKGDFLLAWTEGSALDELSGGESSIGSPRQIGASAGRAYVTVNPAGGDTTAWPDPAAGSPSVDVREDYTQGAFQSAQLAGNVAGPVGGLYLAGDGRGDALLGWTQGPPGHSEVVGAFVQAPPAPFEVTTPIGWVRPSQALISWQEAPDAVAGVTYSVYLDGRLRLAGLTALQANLRWAGLGDGVHHVQVLASDDAGQQTMSAVSELKVAADPPAVRLSLIDHGRGVRISIRDTAAGIDTDATRVSFGDGHSARGGRSARHEYRRAGRYTIRVSVRDNVGNSAVVVLHARIR
jgi:hypothetical protein